LGACRRYVGGVWGKGFLGRADVSWTSTHDAEGPSDKVAAVAFYRPTKSQTTGPSCIHIEDVEHGSFGHDHDPAQPPLRVPDFLP
jgi:hypothetical protein